MSGATPTLIPREPIFPLLLPKPPQPHVMPLPKRRVYGNLNAFRDIQREMDDLSDEENEIDDLNTAVLKRGFTFLIPIGRSLTQQEEKNDDSDDSSQQSGAAPTVQEEDGENDSTQDLDASMEDLDEEVLADTDDNDDMNEEDTEEYDEEPSDYI